MSIQFVQPDGDELSAFDINDGPYCDYEFEDDDSDNFESFICGYDEFLDYQDPYLEQLLNEQY